MISPTNLPQAGTLAGGATTAGVSALPVSALPFTGFGVLWLVLAAVALIALGGAIRRLVPSRQA